MIELEKPLNRSLFLSAQVNQESMLALTKQIIEINESDERVRKTAATYDFDYKPKPIKIYIDSYGGAVYQCFGLLSIMDNSKTPVHTIVTGCAMSCGFLIAIHGKHRSVHKNATLMYHQVSSGMHGIMPKLVYSIERNGHFGLSHLGRHYYQSGSNHKLIGEYDEDSLDTDIERHDPLLVRCVEHLGKDADGMHAKLVIREVHDKYRIEIDRYGIEKVITPEDEIYWVSSISGEKIKE